MTTQIDDQFTDLLAHSFSVETLAGMGGDQRRVMRDMFFAGFMIALTGKVSDPLAEVATYKREIGTTAQDIKARHCVQEALMMRKMEN